MILAKEEKIEIVNQHLKNLEYNKYNLSLSVIEENSAAIPNASIIDSLNLQLTDISAKISALESELTELNSVNG